MAAMTTVTEPLEVPKEGDAARLNELGYEQELKRAMADKGLPLPDEPNWAALVDHLVSKHVEPTLIEPTLLHDYPVELSPFAKRHRENPELVERFEAFADGMEFANAFSELNDPDDQRARFEEQVRHAAAGDENAPPFDYDYIYALEHGMPPTGGIGTFSPLARRRSHSKASSCVTWRPVSRKCRCRRSTSAKNSSLVSPKPE